MLVTSTRESIVQWMGVWVDKRVSIPDKGYCYGADGCSADVAFAISGGSGLLHSPQKELPRLHTLSSFTLFFPNRRPCQPSTSMSSRQATRNS